ncbi:hypothetical protein EVAR_61822_1 [Eumeta japonica]|uniref:Uncharacterized protein n=1 Tax=Eumeta variegata TaxID=151549 RepID=A0A4C1YYA5_EUMVA|nr:hypothetical protein EVAR_61822_1 [Eumeta japonica]
MQTVITTIKRLSSSRAARLGPAAAGAACGRQTQRLAILLLLSLKSTTKAYITILNLVLISHLCFYGIYFYFYDSRITDAGCSAVEGATALYREAEAAPSGSFVTYKFLKNKVMKCENLRTAEHAKPRPRPRPPPAGALQFYGLPETIPFVSCIGRRPHRPRRPPGRRGITALAAFIYARPQ